MASNKWRTLAKDKIMVGVSTLILAGLFALLIPVVRCTYCLGLGSVTIKEMCIALQIPGSDEQAKHFEFWGCDRCGRRGRVTIHREWSEPLPNDILATPHGDLLRSVRALRDGQ